MAEPFKRGECASYGVTEFRTCTHMQNVYTPTERVFVCRDAGEPGGDGGGEGPAGSARLLCPPVHPSGQVSQGELLHPLEMPGRETPLGPVPVRRVRKYSHLCMLSFHV